MLEISQPISLDRSDGDFLEFFLRAVRQAPAAPTAHLAQCE